MAAVSRYEIVEARRWHCGQMARRMRRGQREAIMAAGFDPHRALLARFNESRICRAWMVDGRLMALGGIVGSLLSIHGLVWLALAQEASDHAVPLVREARRQLADVMRTYEELATVLMGDDEPARRFAVWLGFHVGHTGPGQPAQGRQDRTMLAEFIRDEPSLRMPLGDSYAVAVGFHQDSA